MDKFEQLNYNINPQPVPSSFNDGFSQYETLSKYLSLLNQTIESLNLTIDEINIIKDEKMQVQSYLDDIENNRKLDESGNFTGTLNGVTIQSIFSRLDNIETLNTTQVNEIININQELQTKDTEIATINSELTSQGNEIADINQQVKAIKIVTQAEYDVIGTEKNTNNTLYLIKG